MRERERVLKGEQPLLPFGYPQLVHGTDDRHVSWEPDWRYHHSTMFRWEPEGRLSPFNDVPWEPEGRYRHILSTAIAPFWLSAEHGLKSNINALLHDSHPNYRRERLGRRVRLYIRLVKTRWIICLNAMHAQVDGILPVQCRSGVIIFIDPYFLRALLRGMRYDRKECMLCQLMNNIFASLVCLPYPKTRGALLCKHYFHPLLTSWYDYDNDPF